MNRRDFIKRVAIGVGATTVPVAVMAEGVVPKLLSGKVIYVSTPRRTGMSHNDHMLEALRYSMVKTREEIAAKIFSEGTDKGPGGLGEIAKNASN